MDTEPMPFDLRLAAIVTLLSSSALRGATANKTAALRVHLAAAASDSQIDPWLKDAIEQALAGWQAVDCHPASISVEFCPLTAPGQYIH